MVAALSRAGIAVEPFTAPAPLALRTGVPGFLAPVTGAGAPARPRVDAYTGWHDVALAFRGDAGWRAGAWHPDEFLWNAVQGFFANGGEQCHVAWYDPMVTGDPLQALERAVEAMAEIDQVDLLCAPSLMAGADPLAAQRRLLQSSDRVRGERSAEWFVIVDGPPPGAAVPVAAWIDALRNASAQPGDIALYHPWVVPGGDWERAPEGTAGSVPPSGHVAGIYARTDRRVGVHKPPANEEVLGVVDLADGVEPAAPANALVALPGRGIRVWGARTLAPDGAADGSVHVNVRRLVVTLKRWLVRTLDWAVFETNDFRLWVRIHREIEDRLMQLFERGAFAGRSPAQAFRVKCDDENNPADARASGRLQVDVEIAPAFPQQFIRIRLVRSPAGLAAS